MVKLSKRLSCIASLVEQGSVVSDVGCDHGLLSLFLLEKGISEHAYMMDIKKAPLMRAAENAAFHALSRKADFILSDGLKELPGFIENSDKGCAYPDTVIISGMGGALILEIIKNAPAIVKEKLRHWILSPQSEIYDFRKGLIGAGFLTEDERIVFDQGKYYFVIKAAQSAERVPEEADEANLFYGKHNLLRKDPVLKELINLDITKRERLLENEDLPKSRKEELLKELTVMKDAYAMIS